VLFNPRPHDRGYENTAHWALRLPPKMHISNYEFLPWSESIGTPVYFYSL
jgi:hypothetical protein